jgi:hypothetical protein
MGGGQLLKYCLHDSFVYAHASSKSLSLSIKDRYDMYTCYKNCYIWKEKERFRFTYKYKYYRHDIYIEILIPLSSFVFRSILNDRKIYTTSRDSMPLGA